MIRVWNFSDCADGMPVIIFTSKQYLSSCGEKSKKVLSYFFNKKLLSYDVISQNLIAINIMIFFQSFIKNFL